MHVAFTMTFLGHYYYYYYYYY